MTPPIPTKDAPHEAFACSFASLWLSACSATIFLTGLFLCTSASFIISASCHTLSFFSCFSSLVNSSNQNAYLSRAKNPRIFVARDIAMLFVTSNASITACSKVKTNYGNATMSNEQEQSEAKAHPVDTLVMLPCPFCGAEPYKQTAGDVIGTCCEIECDCGMARASVQICDLMTIEERASADFIDYMYPLKYRQRALDHCIRLWNTRST